MKFSFCSIAFRQTKESLYEIIPVLAEIGYDGIEIWANHLSEDKLDLEDLTFCLETHGLTVPMISPYFNITGNQAEWEATLVSAAKVFEYAQILKAPLVRGFTGFLGSDEVDKKLWATAVGRLSLLCDLATEEGLSLALETHPRTLVDNVPSVLRLMADVQRPNLVLNLDIYHMWEVHDDPIWIWNQLKTHVRHVHAKNAVIELDNAAEYPLFHDKKGLQEISDITFLDDGNMNYEPFLSVLVSDDYDSYISIEWFGSDPLEAAEHELTWLKNHIRKSGFVSTDSKG